MNKKNKNIILVGIIALVLIVFLLSINLKTTGEVARSTQEQETIKIGVTLPLTGDLANFGVGERHAIELAIDEVNRNGGVNGREVEIIIEDTQCDPKEGINAANKLINIDKVPVILGEICSGPTLSMAPLAEQSKTILFATAASSPKITDAGDYIFRNYPSDSYQGKYLAEMSYDKLNKRKAAVLYLQIDYGIGVKDAFKKRFSEIGGEIVYEGSFQSNEKDMRTQLAKLKDSKPDVIFFVGYNEESIVFVQQASSLGIDAQIVSTEVFDDPSILEEVGDLADGLIYIVLDSPLSEEFKKKMKEKSGSDQIIIGTPNAYDAVKIVTDVMKKVGSDPERIKEELYKVKDYNGVSGKISFDSNGDIESANFVIKQFKNKEAVELNL